MRLGMTERVRAQWHFLPGVFLSAFFIIRAGYASGGSFLPTLFDDAMISMTYAKTYSTYGELVWYPGAERVQGYSNPGWTMFFVLLHKLEHLNVSAILLVQICGVLILIGIAKNTQSLIEIINPKASLFHIRLYSGSVMFLYPLMFWTLRGMEVGVLSLLLTSIIRAIWKLESKKRNMSYLLLCTFASLGVFIRLDFIIFILAILVSGVIRDKKILLQNLFLFTSSSLSLTAILYVQYKYYGSAMPNTFYLKLENIEIQDRLIRGSLNLLKHLNLLLLPLIFIYFTIRKVLIDKRLLDLLMCLLFGFTYSIWVGGDAWEWSGMTNRYISTTLPLLCAILGSLPIQRFTHNIGIRQYIKLVAFLAFTGSLIGVYTNPIRFEFSRALVYLLIFLVVMFPLITLFSKLMSPQSQGSLLSLSILLMCVNLSGMYYFIRDGGIHVKDDQKIAITSLFLSQQMNSRSSTALFWAGTPGYYLPGKLYDLLGKNDYDTAKLIPDGEFWPGHDKHDFAGVICKRLPDYVFSVSGDLGIPSTLINLGYEITATPHFVVWKRINTNLPAETTKIVCSNT